MLCFGAIEVGFDLMLFYFATITFIRKFIHESQSALCAMHLGHKLTSPNVLAKRLHEIRTKEKTS